MSRPRSIRPRKAPRSQQLGALLRLLGRAEPGLLEAALEPPEAQAAQERAMAEDPEALLTTAAAVCLEAHEAWQRLATRERSQVRGFSLALLGLAAEQTSILERAITEHAALTADHSLAVARLSELVPRCGMLCAQAREVLDKVAGEPCALGEGTAAAPSTTFGLAQMLHRLAHAGQELLRSANVAVRRRAFLYGLNEDFLEGLARAGAELVAIHEKASSTGPVEASRRALDGARRASFLLISQVADAFAAAHRLDSRIPALQSAPKKPAAPAPPRAAEVVVLNVEEAHRGVQLVPYARPAERLVRPAPAPRLLDLGDLGASGVIRKRSKPPLR